jgi:hypothetical protein
MTEPSKGAYGLRLGEPLAEADLVDAPATWPEWHFQWRESPLDQREAQRLNDDDALLDLQPAGQVLIDRLTRTSTLLLPVKPPSEALAHPYLSSTAVITARWAGRQSFHAGAFLAHGGAWGILAEREGGKSSMLAWLASRGYAVLCDDVLVIDQDRAFAGPRCLDLRQSASEHFGLGECIGQVGTRERWRARLGAVEAEVPFRGWVVPAWADEIGADPVKAKDRLATVLAHRALMARESNDSNWLDLIARPMVRLKRPRSWSTVDLAMTCLLDALCQL